MKNSITKFADASIAGLSTVVGGKGKYKSTNKSGSNKSGSNKSGSNKSGSNKSGSKGDGSSHNPCW